LKLTRLAFVGISISVALVAGALCAAQSGPPPATSDANQSSQPPSISPSQTPEQQTPPVQPPAGQTTPPAGQAQGQNADKTGQDQDKDKKDEASTPVSSKDRLFFALPNFLTVDKNGKIIPLTAGQKFKVVAQGAFDPVQVPWYGVLSAISQASNGLPAYGQGWEAYGKRFATFAADGTIENFFVGAIMPSILHQDPRFFPKPEGSFVSRAAYAASRIVITRGDSGKREFNFSEVFGSALASAISTYSYHPRRTLIGQGIVNGVLVQKYANSERTLGNTASVWGSQMGYDAITIVLKEFWPDIRRKVTKKPKPPEQTQTQVH
jgi:hypothetical protein